MAVDGIVELATLQVYSCFTCDIRQVDGDGFEVRKLWACIVAPPNHIYIYFFFVPVI